MYVILFVTFIGYLVLKMCMHIYMYPEVCDVQFTNGDK